MQHQPRKRFGQHFLSDKDIINKIINVINPGDETILEIGPGTGALTIPLLTRAGSLHVLEVDRDLVQIICEKCNGAGQLHIYCNDALEFDLQQVSDNKIKVVGNLPYNISTPLIFHLLGQIEHISEMLFMLQDEVVDRMCAVTGTKAYGRLSVMVQSQCEVTKLFRVLPQAFTPPPKVTSAVVRIMPRIQPVADIRDRTAFSIIVRECFNQRRKTLRNALKNLLAEDQIKQLGIDPRLRPENLHISDFAKLANAYHNQ